LFDLNYSNLILELSFQVRPFEVGQPSPKKIVTDKKRNLCQDVLLGQGKFSEEKSLEPAKIMVQIEKNDRMQQQMEKSKICRIYWNRSGTN